MLQASGVGKSYAGISVLHDVDLALHAGEMLALVGANGAGKSTLVKIICGAIPADAGTLEVGGQLIRPKRVADAVAAGIAVAHQHVTIIRQLTGAENVMLGREPLRGGLIHDRTLVAHAEALARRFGVRIDLGCECDRLSLGELKILDILKALATGPRILILDEPTASLTVAETELLFGFLRDLKQHGLGILFISHHMNEVFSHCDRIAVLKDGAKVHDGAVADISLPEVVRLMVGRAIEETDWTSHAVAGDGEGDVVALGDLRVGRLEVPSLTVRRGEVVGVAGVLGAGQTGLLECLAGAAPATATRLRLGSLPRLPRSVAEAIDHDIYLVADDRLRKAIFRGLSVGENVLAGSLAQISRNGFVQTAKAVSLVRSVVDRLRVKCSGLNQDVMQLSGGNQQKVVFGRWIARIGGAARGASPVLLLDNPTEGVDVGAKAEIYALIRELAQQGAAVLIASAEFSELIALCDRVYCISEGRIAACVPRAELSEDRLLTEVN